MNKVYHFAGYNEEKKHLFISNLGYQFKIKFSEIHSIQDAVYDGNNMIKSDGKSCSITYYPDFGGEYGLKSTMNIDIDYSLLRRIWSK